MNNAELTEAIQCAERKVSLNADSVSDEGLVELWNRHVVLQQENASQKEELEAMRSQVAHLRDWWGQNHPGQELPK